MKRLYEKRERRLRRRRRSKRSPYQISDRYRLVVYRSLRHIYGQIVNDAKGKTLIAASTLDINLQEDLKKAGSKIEKSIIVGKAIADKAKKKKIKKVVFDRNGYLYHGRIKALADGARSGGLEF